MKNYLVIFTFLALVSPLFISAQSDKEDVIYLKNGSIYRGAIVEQIPGATYKIEIYGGKIIIIPAAEVLKVTREEAQSDIEDVIYLKNGSIYRGAMVEQIPGVTYKIEIYGGNIITVAAADVLNIAREEKLYVLERGRRYHFNKLRRGFRLAMETDLSYILYGDGTDSYHQNANNYHFNVSSGAGISLLPELRRGNHFSLLLGLDLWCIAVKKYDFTNNTGGGLLGDAYTSATGTIENGLQVRFQIPVWFRWTYGRKIPAFFQFGWGIGGDFYQGRGTVTEYNNGYYSGNYYPQQTINGAWTQASSCFMNLLMAGAGIRKEIKKGIEIIAFLEIAPINLQFTGYHLYQPNAQFHFGFNFNTRPKYRNNK